MKKYKQLIIAIAIPLIIGFISSFFTMNSMEIYNGLNKPSLSPPGYVFGIVWTALYCMMGIASYLVYTSYDENRENTLVLYGLQLIMNGLWPIFFFVMEKYLFSVLWLLMLIIIVCITTYYFFKANKYAGWLMLPYLIWLSFALYLNFYIYLYN